MTIWIDLEDLYFYAVRNPRPSGIQRVCYEIYRLLAADPDADVRFCRHDVLGKTLHTVTWEEVDQLYAALTRHADPLPAPGSPAGQAPVRERGPLRRFANRLPGEVRQPLVQAIHEQAGVLRALRRTASGVGSVINRLRRSAPTEAEVVAGAATQGVDIRQAARPGDTLLVIGAPWSRADYAELVAGLKRDCGLRFALLVYDLIPILRPEWCAKDLVALFGNWFRTTAPLADVLMAISDATARDVEGWAEREGVRIASPVITLPLGTGFSGESADGDAGGEAAAQAGLTARTLALRRQPYVLFVSTIEARKNHLLAFRAWRQLLRDLPPERVPRLVFAGRVGWLVADLMQQLENANWLDGHVTLVRDPTDAELRALYEGCWFTVFPSLYEGWGLPVTESLSFGKPCVASGRTAVPEAGGPYCLYHDPDSVTEAVALLRRVIDEPELIAERARRLRDEFRPTPWSDAARLILRTLRQEGSATADGTSLPGSRPALPPGAGDAATTGAATVGAAG